MKRYPKIVQCDGRGQIVIPKDIRQELDIEEGSGFWMFSITDEGILLKKVPDEELSNTHPLIEEINKKSSKLDVKPSNLKKAVKKYTKRKKGRLEEI